MTSRHFPKDKPTVAQRNAPVRRNTSAIGPIAHELINHLSVLNLVGYSLFGERDGCDTKIVRNKEIFQRSVQEATALAEQLANYVTGSSDFRPSLEPGKIVRLLRSVPG